LAKFDKSVFGGKSDKKRKLKRHEPKIARQLGRVGVVTRQPLVWLVTTALLATVGGPKGQRAALRGYGCYLLGAVVGNLPKPLFGRPQPRHRRAKRPHVMRGSFPSGHNAAEVAYVFGASQEAPQVFIPLATMALVGHWSLLRAGKHYLSDSIVGGTIGLVVVAIVAKAWPPPRPTIVTLTHLGCGAMLVPPHARLLSAK
jgi:membrane-associated phospholipid phosphatase